MSASIQELAASKPAVPLACLGCNRVDGWEDVSGERGVEAGPEHSTWTYRLMACSQCGYGRVDPLPGAELLGRLYREYAAHAVAGLASSSGLGRQLKVLAARVGAQQFSPSALNRAAGRVAIPLLELAVGKRLPLTSTYPLSLPRSAALLDFGSGAGWWALLMSTLGYQNVHLYDIPGPDWSSLVARGIVAHTGLPAELPEGAYACIRLQHVLEHLQDPIKTLVTLRQKLAPDGRLVLEVPNFGSWSRGRSRREWPHLHLPFHLHHFTVPSLTAALGRAGFRVERVQLVPTLDVARAALPAIWDERLTRPGLRQLGQLAYYAWASSRGEGEAIGILARPEPSAP